MWQAVTPFSRFAHTRTRTQLYHAAASQFPLGSLSWTLVRRKGLKTIARDNSTVAASNLFNRKTPARVIQTLAPADKVPPPLWLPRHLRHDLCAYTSHSQCINRPQCEFEVPEPVTHWECGTCTLLNSLDRTICRVCHSPRPADAAGTSAIIHSHTLLAQAHSAVTCANTVWWFCSCSCG